MEHLKDKTNKLETIIIINHGLWLNLLGLQNLF